MSNNYFGSGSSLLQSGLTTNEINQIKNIGSNTITNTNWTNLGLLDQAVSKTSSVQFYDCSLSDQLKLVNGSYYVSLKAPTLTGNRTITFPDSNVDLSSLPNQSLSTTSSPQFAKLGINQAAGTQALEVNGNTKSNTLIIGGYTSGGSPDQGIHIEWNRDGASGLTYIMNQKGNGQGGIQLGSVSDVNVFDSWLSFDASGLPTFQKGIIKIAKSGHALNIEPTALTATRTLTLPDSDVNLGNLPNQALNTTSTPQFAKLGINQAAGNKALEITGDVGVSIDVFARSFISYSHNSSNSAEQGTHIEWNRDNTTGQTYISNQKGGGTGGIQIGSLDSSNAFTSWLSFDSSGYANFAKDQLKISKSGYYSALQPTTLSANRTLTLPDSDLTLTSYSGPNQSLNTTDSPSFKRLNLTGVGTLVGYNAGVNLTNSTNNKNNTLVGGLAGFTGTDYNNYNTLVGDLAGYAMNGAVSCTGVGRSVLKNITSAEANTCIGDSAGITLTTGKTNICIGAGADTKDPDDEDVIVIGTNSKGYWHNIVIANSTGANLSAAANTIIGPNSPASSITTSGLNVIIGSSAGQTIGTGPSNVIIGPNANVSANTVYSGVAIGDNCTCFSKGIAIGSGSTNNGYQAICLGQNLSNGASEFVFGTGTTYSYCPFGGDTFIGNSDKNLKEDIDDSTLGLEFLKRIRPVSFKWKDKRDKKKHYGFLAQEVKKVMDEMPEASEFDGYEERNGNLMLGKASFIPAIIRAIQELDARVVTLETK